MNQTEQNAATASIKREFERESISQEELYLKFQKKDFDYKIYLARENTADNSFNDIYLRFVDISRQHLQLKGVPLKTSVGGEVIL